MRHSVRHPLAAAASLLALAVGATSIAAQGVRPMLLHAAPDSGYVYLSWNQIPTAWSYQVEWRRQSTPAWQTLGIDSGSYHASVMGLQNDVAYEFRVRANGRADAPSYASPVVVETPRMRTDCDDTTNFACNLSGLEQFYTNTAGGQAFLCEGAQALEPVPNAKNCAYYSGTRVFGFDRYYGRVFSAPPRAAPRALIRDAGRRAIWGDEDPFNAPDQFRFDVHRLNEPYKGLVEADSVDSYIIRLIPEISSRFTIYRPRNPVAGQYVIYHEGHGLTANTSGADFINWFLLKGWTVVGMDMPLEGDNATDARYPFDSHDALRWYHVAPGHALNLFLLPVKTVVDHLMDESPIARPNIVLAGRSGGGWTTCMYGAIDDRITVAIEISGCVPLTIALDTASLPAPNVLHFETLQPIIYDQVSMIDFITAAGSRGNFHFFSENDPSLQLRTGDAYVQYLNGLGQADNASPRTRNRTRVHVGTQKEHRMDTAAFDALAEFMRDIGLPVYDREPSLGTTSTSP